MKLATTALFALFTLVNFSLFAQDWSTDVYKFGEQYPGYVIDKDGKKTEGFIKYRNRYVMQNDVIFFTEKGNKKTKVKYKTADLKEYKVADKLYHCINYSGGLSKKAIRANLLVKEGCIMEYVWYNRDENWTTMRKKSGESDKEFMDRMYPPKTVYYNKQNNKQPRTTDYFAMGFAKKMSEYISDNAELSKKVAGKEKGYRMLKILNIIAEYNESCK